MVSLRHTAAVLLSIDAGGVRAGIRFGCDDYPEQSPGYNNNLTQNQLTSGAVTRNYAVYVPSTCGADKSKQWPLIVDYHGRCGNDDESTTIHAMIAILTST